MPVEVRDEARSGRADTGRGDVAGEGLDGKVRAGCGGRAEKGVQEFQSLAGRVADAEIVTRLGEDLGDVVGKWTHRRP
ncbi:hypothetical protein GCM10011579_033990 [Streptomyces albiflavescens]|uniref:Uncharacterized protein n=1 Tax=Streptomyces albiflavescens TaxID=1623582 RepID=A0A917Y3E6_9ACTN|nr:hypothetical protein [Streptomyces albiflavescens]GGN64522.1 hypothetical protein GCM10011579_033990 [Streptomyces albiflavescens]